MLLGVLFFVCVFVFVFIFVSVSLFVFVFVVQYPNRIRIHIPRIRIRIHIPRIRIRIHIPRDDRDGVLVTKSTKLISNTEYYNRRRLRRSCATLAIVATPTISMRSAERLRVSISSCDG